MARGWSELTHMFIRERTLCLIKKAQKDPWTWAKWEGRFPCSQGHTQAYQSQWSPWDTQLLVMSLGSVHIPPVWKPNLALPGLLGGFVPSLLSYGVKQLSKTQLSQSPNVFVCAQQKPISPYRPPPPAIYPERPMSSISFQEKGIKSWGNLDPSKSL